MSSNVTDPGVREERSGGALLLSLDRPTSASALDEATITLLMPSPVPSRAVG